ncbi:hypothetical protein [Nocardia sp. NPDC047648]|uniref:hypothetical protein n=1 Tax=Nocardia sp. NPDC047648 TaxID=3155625 RepID=UPI0033C1AB6C
MSSTINRIVVLDRSVCTANSERRGEPEPEAQHRGVAQAAQGVRLRSHHRLQVPGLQDRGLLRRWQLPRPGQLVLQALDDLGDLLLGLEGRLGVELPQQNVHRGQPMPDGVRPGTTL